MSMVADASDARSQAQKPAEADRGDLREHDAMLKVRVSPRRGAIL